MGQIDYFMISTITNLFDQVTEMNLCIWNPRHWFLTSVYCMLQSSQQRFVGRFSVSWVFSLHLHLHWHFVGKFLEAQSLHPQSSQDPLPAFQPLQQLQLAWSSWEAKCESWWVWKLAHQKKHVFETKSRYRIWRVWVSPNAPEASSPIWNSSSWSSSYTRESQTRHNSKSSRSCVGCVGFVQNDLQILTCKFTKNLIHV